MLPTRRGLRRRRVRPSRPGRRAKSAPSCSTSAVTGSLRRSSCWPRPGCAGESASASRWQDLDLDGGRISIVQTVIAVNHQVRIGSPKTAKGRRTVARDPGTVSALREHRARQAAERLMMGAGFTDHGLMFCRPDGGPLHPERFSRTFAEQAAKAGLPTIRLHDLRHSWATLALSDGVHPKVVQERLGHAAIGITLDVYSHVTEGLQGDAAALVAGMIGGVSRPLAGAGGEDRD